MNLLKTSLITLLCSLTCMTAWAEELDHLWSQRFGDEGGQEGWSVAVDGSGNVVLAGHFRGTVDFGGDLLTSAGSDDIFVAKFDQDGNHIWSQRFGDSEYQRTRCVAVDGSGSLLLTGEFAGTVDFGGGILTSPGDLNSIFLVKFDPDGVHLWSKRFGDEESQQGWSVAADEDGNVLLTGFIFGTANFGGGPLESEGFDDVFLAKFTPDGTHLWSQVFGDPWHTWGRGVATDGSGNILLTGHFFGTVDFGGGLLTSVGAEDVFLAKFDPDGAHLWSKSFGDAAEGYWCGGESVAMDATGNVHLAGYFGGIVDFGGGPLSGDGGFDIFLAKFDPSGTHLWSQGFGDPDGAFRCRGWSTAVDVSGDVLLTGELEGTVDFGGAPLTSSGAEDIFLAKFDPSGTHLWSRHFGDAGVDVGYSVAVDGAEDALLTGFFQGTVDFGGGPLTSEGSSDVFLAKFGSDEPTPVLLSQISIREVGVGVELGWSALSDISIAQFEIFRREGPDAGESRKLATLDAAVREQTYRDEAVIPGKTYYYWIVVLDITGARERFGPFSITFAGSNKSRLLSSYPNPVVDQTAIRFYIPRLSHVDLRVYDPMGRLVRTLVRAQRPAGNHTVSWDGTNEVGTLVGDGAYFYRLEVNGETRTGRMILAR